MNKTVVVLAVVFFSIAGATSADSSNLIATHSAIAAVSNELKKDETFTSKTDVREYKFSLDDSSGMVHLNVAAEIHRGRIGWELIDPTGAVRSKVGTTEHGSMNTDGIKSIKGEWLLRVTLEDATGNYHIHWTQ
jgi:hypothetical protein